MTPELRKYFSEIGRRGGAAQKGTEKRKILNQAAGKLRWKNRVVRVESKTEK